MSMAKKFGKRGSDRMNASDVGVGKAFNTRIIVRSGADDEGLRSYRSDTDIDSAQSHSPGNSFNFFSTRDVRFKNRPNSRAAK
jgi:hypothetical protein